MTEADWKAHGVVACPLCEGDHVWKFVGAASDGVWSVVRCLECDGEIEVSPSWIDEHLCECGTAFGDLVKHHRAIERLARCDPEFQDWHGHDELRDAIATWSEELRTLDSMRGAL